MNLRDIPLPTKIAFLIAVLLVITVAVATILSFQSNESNIAVQPTPQPTRPQSTPTPTPPPFLTLDEISYPEATPQPYYSSASTSAVGTLIVTSVQEDVRVMIDDGEEEADQTPTKYPIHITPFRVEDIPVGEHTLRAAKYGYIFQTIPFRIDPNTITRIEVNLKRIQSVN